MNLSNFQNLNQGIIPNIIFFLILLWSTAWKGFALWHASAAKERNWFVAILFINTVGLLEIAYLFFFSKNKLILKEAVSNLRGIFSK